MQGSPRLIGMTETAPYHALELGGAAVVEQRDKLAAYFEARGQEDLALFFAEPVVGSRSGRGFRAVSWYTPMEGRAVPLPEAGGEERESAVAHLRRMLVAVQPHLDNPEAGPLIRRALLVPGESSVMAVGGRAVLVNWAMAPSAVVEDPDALARHWVATLGPYADFTLTSLEPRPGAAGATRASGAAKAAAVGGAAALGAAGVAAASAARAGTGTNAGPEADPEGGYMNAEQNGADGGGSGGGMAGGGAYGGMAAGGAAVASVPWYQRGWVWALCVLLLLGAGIVIGILLWPWFEKAPEPSVETLRNLEAQRAVNQGLEDQIRRLRQALQGDVCAQGELLLGPTSDIPMFSVEGEEAPGVVPGPGAVTHGVSEPDVTEPDVTEPDVPATVPPGEDNATSSGTGGATGMGTGDAPADDAGGGASYGNGSTDASEPAPGPAADAAPRLNDLLERATVLVIAPSVMGPMAGNGMGTAFFVAPNTLVTNRHVIEGADPERVYVTNHALGGVRPARVLAVSTSANSDFALLGVTVPDPDAVAVLRATEEVEPLDSVVAAGYPALLSEDDPQYRALVLGGDATAIPELVFSTGEVSVLYDLDPPVVVHTASLSQGNSGGPLVDRCGRVVGVNTLIKFDDQSYNQGNYSISSNRLLAFLRANGVNMEISNGRCLPPSGSQG